MSQNCTQNCLRRSTPSSCDRVLPPSPGSSKINITLIPSHFLVDRIQGIISVPKHSTDQVHQIFHCRYNIIPADVTPHWTTQSFVIIWYWIFYRNRLSGSTKDSIYYQCNFIYSIIVTALTVFTQVPSGFVRQHWFCQECFPPIFERALSDGTEKNWGVWRQT